MGVSGLSEGFSAQPVEADLMLCVPGRLPKVLQCVNISVVSEKICSELYAHVYHPSMFCAGGGQDQKDSCHVRDGGREEGRRSRERWKREGTGTRWCEETEIWERDWKRNRHGNKEKQGK